MDADCGYVSDNRSGNSTLINKPGIPDWVPFHYGRSNHRMYVDWFAKENQHDPRSAVITRSKYFNMKRK
jgi:hypothetical protein